MPTDHIRVAAYLPADLVEKIDKWAKQHEKQHGLTVSRNQAFIALLRQKLDEVKHGSGND
jgi:metal-responsive CopG/Arc/MetJ family transcriptional regulator